jgi:mitochondrial translocator assembly and maintenance protein 41
MKFGENPRKVANLVETNLDGFRTLYRPLIQARSAILKADFGDNSLQTIQTDLRKWEQNIAPMARVRLLEQLPPAMKTALAERYRFEALASHHATLRDALQSYIGGVVRASSWRQALKGVLTTGLRTSLHYAREKLAKARRSTT